MAIDLIAVILLLATLVGGLALVPFGLPGLWLMVGGIVGYGWLTGFRTVGVVTISVALGLAFVGEVLEAWLGFRLARRYGASSRAGWGALVGGLVGAALGVPVPLVGSVIGAFLGAFLGAALFELTASRGIGHVVGAGWGAVLGRAAAGAIKIGLGLVMLVVTAFAAIG